MFVSKIKQTYLANRNLANVKNVNLVIVLKYYFKIIILKFAFTF